MATSESSSECKEAFVTLATNNNYAHGVLALGESLRRTGTTRDMVAMLTEGVTEDMRILIQQHWKVQLVEEMNSGDEENLALLKRPELGVTFSKLHVWKMVEYTKCVFLDADALVLSNVDDLFERDEFAAAPDIGWPDLFNSGVFVAAPNIATFSALVNLAKTEGSYDGGDQGLLNTYWSDWGTGDTKHRLPFTYNVVANLTYSYPPAIKRFFKDIKIIHFLGSVKPWIHQYDKSKDEVYLHPSATHYAAEEFVKKWWQIYTDAFPSSETSVSLEYTTTTTVDAQSTVINEEELTKADDEARRRSWEQGLPDYHGADKSDRIIEHISKQLKDL